MIQWHFTIHLLSWVF